MINCKFSSYSAFGIPASVPLGCIYDVSPMMSAIFPKLDFTKGMNDVNEYESYALLMISYMTRMIAYLVYVG